MKKLIFALLVIAAMLIVAMPVAAQGPNPNYGAAYLPNPYIDLQNPAPWYNRTPEMTAAWAGDPFGGNPRLPVEVTYVPDGKGGVLQKIANAAWPYQGIVAKFGATPWMQYDYLGGGVPSTMSGDGTAPRKAIYIGGAWADPSVNPASKYGDFFGPVNLPGRASDESPFELPACATVKIPAAGSRWFKLDTWNKKIAGQAYSGGPDTFAKINTQIWLDDELDGATKPSGSAVFGAANKYMYGTAPDDYWSKGAFFYGAQSAGQGYLHGEGLEGYVMVVYGPNAMNPNFAFAPPNAWLYSLNVSASSGSVSRSGTAAGFAGQPQISAASGGDSAPAGNSISGINTKRSSNCNIGSPPYATSGPGFYCDSSDAAATYATFNNKQPQHLLWSEGTYDGWVHLRVVNQMIWDGTVTVCSYRQITADRASNATPNK